MSQKRAKRLLSVLLSGCMLLGTFIPTAGALEAKETETPNAQEAETLTRLVDLSELDWTTATHGVDYQPSYTVQKNMPFEAGNTNNSDAKLTLLVDGEAQTFEKGVGTNATSDIEYNIEGKGYTHFTGYMGVDYGKTKDYLNPPGPDKEAIVDDIQVLIDGEVMVSTGKINPTVDAVKIDIEIPEDAKTFAFKALAGENFYSDEVDFVGEFTQSTPKTTNVALGKSVQLFNLDGTLTRVNPDRPGPMAVDGIIPDATHPDSNYVDYGKEPNPDNMPAYLQLDLGASYEFNEIKLWRYWDGRTYNDTVIACSDDPNFAEGTVTVLYNADADNTMGLGAGTDEAYAETKEGHTFTFDTIQKARYIRVYSNGNTKGVTNHIVELQVFGWDFSTSNEKIIDDNDPSVSFLGNSWSSVTDENAEGGSSHQNVTDGEINDIAVAELNFTGTGVKVFGKAGADFGNAKISVLDRSGSGENYLATVSTVSSKAETDENGRQIISFVGLENKPHILKIVAKDKFDIDYFSVSTQESNTNAVVTRIECEPVTMKVYDALTLDYSMQDKDGNYVCKKPELKSETPDLLTVTDDRPNAKYLNDPGLIAMKEGDASFTISRDGVSASVDVTIEPIVPAENYRREVDHEHPLYIENYYYGDDLSGSDVTMLWDSIPDDMKPYTVILLIAERSIYGQDSWRELGKDRNASQRGEDLDSEAWIKKTVETCNENKIPCAVQAVNGETGIATISIEFFEELAAENEYLYGYNGAEMYNGGNCLGNFSGYNDYKNFMTQLTRICVENGMYLMWTDTELNTVGNWLETYAPLSNIFRENKHNIILQNKQSFSDPSSEALYKGLWLSDYCDNWGVASDWWNWQINGHNSGMNGTGLGALAKCYDMPEVRYVQDIMRVASQGATCFKSEAQWYSNATLDMRLPAYERAILPFLERIVSGEIKIPTKEEVMERTKAIAVGKNNWLETYNRSISDVNPSNSKYGIIPWVPSNVPQEEIDKLKEAGMTVFDSSTGRMTTNALDRAYAGIHYELDKSGNAQENGYLETYGDGVWYWMNTYDKDMTTVQSSKFAPVKADADYVKISALPYTLAVMTEEDDRISVHLQNYRSVKSDLKSIDPPDETPCVNAYYYSHRIAKQLRDGTLEDKTRLTTTFELKTNTKPELVFAPVDEYTNPVDANLSAETKVEWNEETKVATISIQHNGPVNFDIVTDPASKEAPTSVTLDKSSMTLDRQTAQPLKATVSAKAKNQNVIWKSSNPSVATVSNVGMVAAVGAGTAEITATTADGNVVSEPCVVTVNNPQIRYETTEGGEMVVSTGSPIASGALVENGANITVSLTPDDGYSVGALVINGQDMTAQLNGNSLTFVAKNDSKVQAFFVKGTVGDKTFLQVCIDNANKEDKNLYTAESFEPFQEKLDAAKKLLEDGAATEEQLIQAANAVYAAQENLVERIYFTEEDPLVLPSGKEQVTLEAEFGLLKDRADRNYVRPYYMDSTNPNGEKVITASNGVFIGSFAAGNQLSLKFYAPAAGTYTFMPYYKGTGTYSWSGTNVESGSAEVDPTGTDKWSVGAFQVTVTEAGLGEIIFTAPNGGTPDTDKFEIVAGEVVLPNSYCKIPQSQMTATADSEHGTTGTEGPAANVLDGNASSTWHTKWGVTPIPACPHSLDLDLGGTYLIGKLSYLPRQTGNNGNINAYTIQVNNGQDDIWTTVASGSFANNNSLKLVEFDPVSAAKVRILVESSYGSPANTFASAAEINVYEYIESSPEADKAELQAAYDKYSKYSEKDYTAESWADFKEALDEAKGILEDADAGQQDVDDALSKLEEKAEKLEKASPKVDKTVLQDLIEKAQGYVDDGTVDTLMETVKKIYLDTLAKAKEVLANEAATREEVLDIQTKLAVCITTVDMKAADKTALGMLLESANYYTDDVLKNYLDEGQEAFKTARSEAQAVYEDGDAFAEEVKAAYDKLFEAMTSLHMKPNKDALKALIDMANGLDSADYTAESFAVLKSALASAQEVYNESQATEAEVKKAEETLQSAIDGLVKAPADSPSGNESNEGGASSEQPAGGGTSTEAGEEKPDAEVPATGSTAPIAAMVVLMLSAGVGLLALKRKEKQEQ